MRNRFLAFAITFAIIFSSNTFSDVVWYPLPAEAYKFGQKYPDAQKLLFAFDYGHALVYERLLLNKGKIQDPILFEQQILTEILSILKNPPNVKADEDDIAPNYVYSFPLTINLFDWSHMLHQFVLDVLATSKDRGPKMINRVNEIFEWYKSNKQVAISDVCKTMLFMDAHYFSKDFRRSFPSFNLLIWSYHWFQIKLFEALMKPTEDQRDLEVKKVVDKFKKLISDLPDSADFDMMPQTEAEAPIFSKKFPHLAPAFDNNHMLHDIVSDLLTSDKVSKENIRLEGLRFARMAMDKTSFIAAKCTW